jgi:hypothetical protein
MNKWFFVLMDKGLDNDISAERHIFFSGFFRRRFFLMLSPVEKFLTNNVLLFYMRLSYLKTFNTPNTNFADRCRGHIMTLHKSRIANPML